jgi:dipeptidyl aminopeptidase/acylaminoacyl peptidase
MELSPDGKSVLYVKSGQIYLARVDATITDPSSQDAAAPLFRVFGVNGSDRAYEAANRPVWSPDGKRIAFVSVRRDHSFVTVYDVASRKISYMAPSVDFDSAPVWSPDGKRLAFLRRPGLPFGAQTEPTRVVTRGQVPAGFAEAKFRGGYTKAVWVADVETGEGTELWHNAPGDTLFAEVARLYWAGDHIVFDAEPNNWRQFYAVSVASPGNAVLLTPGEGEVEHVSFSNDGRWLYYAANIGDLERRSLWRVPVSGGRPEQLTRPPAIDTYPVVLPSGIVAAMRATARVPQSVTIMPATGGEPRLITKAPAGFPADLHVDPESVTLTAADGATAYGQVFLPPGLKPGEKRPAVLFIHGGPRQQTLLGYHYQQPHGFYQLAYAMCEYFANKGYVAMSVNYRSGLGYGRAFRTAKGTGGAGNTEYQDVLAAGLFLKQRADVDPTRIGVWGLSYGGILTSQSLARNSDVFAAGADIGGVHLRGTTIDPADVSYTSSSASAIATWRSPVILFAGDDDRNVDFSQTVGLVQLLRAHDVPYELTVFPNDTHYFLVFDRWVQTFKAIDDFFDRVLIRKEGVRPGW